MKLFLKILSLLLTWLNISATPAFSNVALPSHAIYFLKAESQNLDSELKIIVSNFTRSEISENSISQKAVLWESSVFENRAREANVGVVQGAGVDLLSFVNKTLTQKIDDIKTIWNTKYPIPDMLGGRSFFEDIMGQYRYLKSSGWSHTGDISEFFKGVDFYKGSVVGDQIFANTAVSMKTTITTNVDNWLASAPMQKNIEFLQQGLNPAIGLSSNNKTKVSHIQRAHKQATYSID